MSRHDDFRDERVDRFPDDIIDIDERSDEEISLDETELKDKYAFGLQIDPETGLPRITAMGRGLIAQRIIETAKESGVAVENESAMVGRMFRPKGEQAIPSRTYEIIAEILTFIYRMNEFFVREDAGEYLEEEYGEPEEAQGAEEEFEDEEPEYYEDEYEPGADNGKVENLE